MKLHFNFQFSAESGKMVKEGLSAEIGQINCPIEVELDLEAAEVQQTISLVRDLAKEIPGLLKQKGEQEIELAERRGKIDEHITRVRHQLEADNIRLKADLAKACETEPAKSSEPEPLPAEPRTKKCTK